MGAMLDRCSLEAGREVELTTSKAAAQLIRSRGQLHPDKKTVIIKIQNRNCNCFVMMTKIQLELAQPLEYLKQSPAEC
jgi:hypothetical protein